MLKKVIIAMLAFCLVFGSFTVAVSAVNESMPETSRGTDDRAGGGRMGRPPIGNMQEGEMPAGMPSGESPTGEFTPPEGFSPPQGENFTFPQNPGEFTPPERTENNNEETAASKTSEFATEENPQTPENGEEGEKQNENSPFGGQMPEGMGRFPANMQNGQNAAEQQPTGFLGFVKTYSTPITSVILLGLAFIFVVFYRKKNY